MVSVIDMIKSRSASNIAKQIEESKTTRSTGYEHEVQMKNFYDNKNAVKGKDVGFVRLRLLPNKFNEDGEFTKDIVPLREYFHRNTSLEEFKMEQQGTKWYVEVSRTTLNAFKEFKTENGNSDPMQEYLSSIYEMHVREGGDKENETVYGNYYKSQKARQSYIVNAYVEECPYDTSLEGKVVAFKFGAGIYKAIATAIEPRKLGSREIPPIDIFNPISDTGASLMIMVHNPKGDLRFVEYEATFDACAPLQIDGHDCTEEEAVNLIEQTHDLFKVYITDRVKSYEDACTQFKKQYGFAHDKYSHGSVFQKILKENAETESKSAVPPEKEEVTEEVQTVSSSAESQSSLMDRFKSMVKQNSAAE